MLGMAISKVGFSRVEALHYLPSVGYALSQLLCSRINLDLYSSVHVL